MRKKPCKYASLEYSGDCYECEAYYKHKWSCNCQKIDYNPDGTVNVVECNKADKESKE